MKHPFLTTTAIGTALIVLGSTATADVSAAEVWADWRKSLVLYGENNLSIGSETMSGDTLTISDVTMSIVDDVSSVTMNMGTITLTEQGDGTVKVDLPPSYPMTVTSNAGEGGLKMTFTQEGADIVVSGDPSELTYTMEIDKYGLTVDEITEGDKTVEADARFAMNDIAGTYVSRDGNLQNMTYDMTAGSIDMLMDIAPPEAPGDHFVFSGKVLNIAMGMELALPLDISAMAPENLFVEGLAMTGNYTFDEGAYIFDVKAEGEQTSGSVSTGSGKLDFKMDDTLMSYDSLTNDVAMTLEGGAMPFPIELAASQYGTGFDMPLNKSDELSDFGLRLNLTDLAVNDMIWMMADPSGQLPRDPATLLLDLSGKVKMLMSLLDPEDAEMLEAGEQPAELHAMTLDNFKLSAAGAEVTGTGDFTFDNSDLTTFDGMPAPTGDVTVNIKGANGLIDNLVGMGLLPEDQAMMGRMMMGMFARTVGDDELTSKIEINDQGHIIANGQRIQ